MTAAAKHEGYMIGQAIEILKDIDSIRSKIQAFIDAGGEMTRSDLVKELGVQNNRRLSIAVRDNVNKLITPIVSSVSAVDTTVEQAIVGIKSAAISCYDEVDRSSSIVFYDSDFEKLVQAANAFAEKADASIDFGVAGALKMIAMRNDIDEHGFVTLHTYQDTDFYGETPHQSRRLYARAFATLVKSHVIKLHKVDDNEFEAQVDYKFMEVVTGVL